MLFVDSAERGEIKKAFELPGVEGITTNPTLIAKARGREQLSYSEYVEYAETLCRMSLQLETCTDLMIQGVGSEERILAQADRYLRILGNKKIKLWIKLLPIKEAISYSKSLQNTGCKTLITGMFTATQAYLAMQAGADGVAVYLGRLKRFEVEGWKSQLERIASVLKSYEKMCLLASFPDRETVEAALSYSSDLTIPPNILETLLTSSYSEEAIKTFNSKVT